MKGDMMLIIDENYEVQEKFVYEERPLQQGILFLGAITYKDLIDKFDLQEVYKSIINNLSKKETEIFNEISEMNTWKMLQSLSNHYYLDGDIFISFENYIAKLSDERFLLYLFPYNPRVSEKEILESFNDIKIQNKITEIFKGHDYYKTIIDLIYSKTVNELKKILINHFKFSLKLHDTRNNNEYKKKIIDRKQLIDQELLELIEKYEKTNKEIVLISQTAYQPYILFAEDKDRIYLYIMPLESRLNIPSEKMVEGLKSISDTIKLQIIKYIKNGENTLNRLNQVLPNSKSTIHHHIHQMKCTNLITQRDNNYFVNDEEIDKLFKSVHSFLGTKYD